jgi:thiamine kinase-like enzyme
MTHKEIIKEVAAKALGVMPGLIRVRERLMGGMSNYTYIFELKARKYTFRIPGKRADKFVDRVVEKHNINLVDDLHLNNKTLYLDIETGYKIAAYIEGQPLSELNPMDYLRDAAIVLQTIHQSGLKSDYDYNPLKRLMKYEEHTYEYDYVHTERYYELKKRFWDLKDKYMDPEKLVLCHGDSQISNFVLTPEKELRLMDWEFSGNNDPFYDIACFGNNDFNHALALLPVYLGREATTEEYNKLYFYRTFQCLQWHNVALYKEFIGLSLDLGVDFMFVANLYLDKAEGFLDSIK